MSVLTLLNEGATHAARAVALLFTVPLAAHAAEPTAPTHVSAASEFTVVDRAFEVRVLGLLAELRIVQALRNDGAAPLDLGAQVIAASQDATLDHLALTRDGRTVDLLAPEGGCGDTDEPAASRAEAALDESIADVAHLAPGARAEIETASAAALVPAGDAWRVALPPTLAPQSGHARFAAGDAATLVVVAPADMAGVARLTLRPATRPARVVELGRLVADSAIVVPLEDAALKADLADGAIELEAVDGARVIWTTLPLATADRRAVTARAE